MHKIVVEILVSEDSGLFTFKPNDIETVIRLIRILTNEDTDIVSIVKK